MVELNHRERTIKVKLVYYGPPVGGKTTNLQVLHRSADARRRGEMISINSAQDRTILFDLLPLKTPGFRGFDLRLQLLAVPGQAVYAATRRLVLKGADSLVFVANSALDRWEENIHSYREMVHNLLSHHLDPATMPIVLQYNKRDLPQVLEIEALDRALNVRGAEAIPAVAVRGEGVLETFTAILAQTVEDLATRYAILNVKQGTPVREWAEQAVRDLFGSSLPPAAARASSEPTETRKLSAPARPAAGEDSAATIAVPPDALPAKLPSTGRTSAVASAPAAAPAATAKARPPSPPAPPPAAPVTKAQPAPTVQPARAAAAPAVTGLPEPEPKAEKPRGPALVAPEAPSGPAPGHVVLRASPVTKVDEAQRASPAFPEGRAIELVESYAEASAQLGNAVTELREERDAARQRLDDLRRAMQAAQEILAGTPFDAALVPVLACMARVAGASQAAFWVPRRGEPPRAVALLGLTADPVLPVPGALRHVSEAASRGVVPRFALASDDLDLAQALDSREGRFAALLAVPFRTPGGLQGIGVFYYDADTARPGNEALEHLAEIPRALSAALELAATLQTVKAAERALELALAGSASLRGLEGVVRSIERLRDGLAEIRNRPDAPPWFVEQYLQLAPALAAALEDGRSLLGFNRGEIRRESVYLEDLLAELRTPEVGVDLDPAVEVIAADASLLRVALRAIADEVRSRVGSNTAPLVIKTSVWSDGVRVSVHTDAPRSERAPVTAGLGLGVARRIAELHGGSLAEPDPQAAGPVVLILPAA